MTALIVFFLFVERVYGGTSSLDLAQKIREATYSQILQSYTSSNYQQVTGVDLLIAASDFTSSSAEVEQRAQFEGEQGPILLWTEEGSWLEWTLAIPESGLYNIALRYYPLPGTGASIRRAFRIDGQYPFTEAKRVLFERTWSDVGPPQRDNRGDDLRPGQKEVPIWQVKSIQDPDGMARQDLLFYFSKGRHTLRIEAIREPMALHWIRIYAPLRLPSYAEALREYRSKGYKEAGSAFVKVQAEDAWLKSDPTLRREFGSDPLSEPPAGTHFRLNEFGSWRWRVGGQWASWKISVPETGLYTIGFRYWQGFYDLPTTRSVTIDGAFQFQEMKEVKFPRADNWDTKPLSDGKGEPYLFYLSRGEHTLKLTVKVGPVADVVNALEDIVQGMGRLSREIVLITGPDPDPNRDWSIRTWIPDIAARLKTMADTIDVQIRTLTAMAGTRPLNVNTLSIIVTQLRSMVDNPESVPRRLNDFSTSQSTLGYWILELKNQPLSLDYLFVASPEVRVPNLHATLWQRLGLTWRNLLASFRKDYTGVGNVASGNGEAPVLSVWVARGREWADIIKDMSEDDFTPSTGTKVNMSIFPAGQSQALLFAAAGGNPPDVALGVDGNLPVEFAIRGALQNLNEFPDYAKVITRFRPGALIPYHYQNGDYALPENQDFGMLFYRTDILDSLGLKPPQTWNDVYEMMPRLHEQGLEFYYGAPQIAAIGPTGIASGFVPFLYQRGGHFYSPDGLRSGLDTPEALAAFQEWTGLYTNYKVPEFADFYNRMRTGETPIGVANYWTYVLLSTAAPELTGWWKMVPMPGHTRPDGSIDRTTGGIAQTAIIFKSSKHTKEAWDFVKWWTSAPVQVRFGNELEALLGVEARWNTANVEALKMLPWPSEDIDAILQQWQWFQEVPVVPGGYFTSRHVMNAWNRVVLQGWNPREALEQSVVDIDKELARKQEEFGIHGAETQTVRAGR